MSHDELAALAKASAIESSPCPALLAWIECLIDAERHRRIDVELPTMTAEDAIDDVESVTALAAAVAIRDSFPEGAPRAFLSAVVAILQDGTRQ